MADVTTGQVTARRWELAIGSDAVNEIHSSGIAGRLLDDICTSAVRTLDFAVAADVVSSREVIAEYPQVLSRCHSLSFNEPAQALAYLAIHVPDRYYRVFQALEALLVRGMLPVGHGTRFAAVDIGAGPGPVIFAVRSFYAALNHVAGQYRPAKHVSTLGVADVVELSDGMNWVMHHFAEHLVMIERAGHVSESSAASSAGAPNPCAAQLAASATPFGARYADFSLLDLRREHNRSRHQIADELSNELDISLQDALRLAYREPINVPSAYALILMTNFLTTPDAVPQFRDAIQRLMGTALVPGGVILVLGATGAVYQATYVTLDRIAVEVGLRVMDGFDEPLQAGNRPDEHAMLQVFARRMWHSLVQSADNLRDVQRELRTMRANDIFDESISLRLPRFQMRAYRRGALPKPAA